jgi:hypothetical protein
MSSTPEPITPRSPAATNGVAAPTGRPSSTPGAAASGGAGGGAGGSGAVRPQRVLVVHRQGESLRLLTARIGKPGETLIVVEEARSILSASLTLKAAKELPVRAGVERLLAILPPDAAATRPVVADAPPELPPDATPDAVAGIMALVAEAHAPGVASHRRAAGLVSLAPGLTPTACSVAWSGPIGDALTSLDRARGVDAWLSEVLALAWLTRLSTLGGNAPSATAAGAVRPSLYAQRRDAGICLCVQGASAAATGAADESAPNPGRLILRSLLTDPGEDQGVGAWEQELRDAMLDVCELAGVESVPTIEPTGDVALLIAGRSTLSARFGGVPDDPAWLRDYAIALGGAAFELLATPSQRPVAMLSNDPPGSGHRWLGGLVEFFARPLVAAAVFLLVGALVLSVPVYASYDKLRRVKVEVAKLRAVDDGVARAAAEADLLALTQERRWPVTALIAELVGSAPKEISVESVSFKAPEPGAKAGEATLRVTGTVSALDADTRWRSALAAGTTFRSPEARRTATEVGGAFELGLSVASALAPMNADPKTLESLARSAGENATLVEISDAPASAGSAGPASGAATRPVNANARPRGRDNARAPQQPTGTPLPASDRQLLAVPIALTDAQIARLDRAGVTREFGDRRRASLQPGVSANDKQRLEEEVAKLRARLVSTGGGGGGGGGASSGGRSGASSGGGGGGGR